MKKVVNSKKAAKVFILTAASMAMLFASSCSSDASDDSAIVNEVNPSVEDSNSSSAKPTTSDNSSTEVKDGSVITAPTAEVPVNAAVKIVKNEGWLNSAYIIFEQIEGATYTVKCDDKEIDAQLIRYYDEYTYYEKSEDPTTLQVTWTKKTLKNVVRADAMGLASGSHTMSVCANGTNGSTEYSTASMTVADHDRSGFCFTGSETPGAYNKDGTLKNGTVVIYLTEGNKKTVTATIGKSSYTGISEITQAIKSKNISSPVCIRVIGKVSLDGLACADMKSAYALGVKEASKVTIEGVGDDATMAAGVAAFKSEYIEIANLGLMKWGGGKDGDGVSLKESKYVWVHNNDYFYGDAGSDADQAKGDGSMDLKDDSQYVTVAYNHFWDAGKMSLCGMKSESGDNYITYHHNWFDHSDSRHPRVRRMSVHVYNNYFDGNAKYGVGITSGGNGFVEGNFFRNAHDPMMISNQGTDATGAGTFSGEKGGQIKSWNNKFVQNNTNGVKFQFTTNKYDYTNNKELGEYKEWYETVGTNNGDGTWTITDAVVTDTADGIADTSLICVEEASKKGAYYQGSKGKDMFTLKVPSNTTKVILKAKTGSSTSGATTTVTVNGVKSASIPNTGYADYEFAISSVTDNVILVSNSGSNSLNISAIKVLASSGWETKLTSGADMSNIDAFEVDSRNQIISDSIKSRSGDYSYNNFDTVLGDSGLGLTNLPTTPEAAKNDVLTYAGRHNPNYAWNFNNATDDAKYSVDETLNKEIVAVTNLSFPAKIQGSADSSTTGGSGDSGDNGGSTTPTVLPEGAAQVTFTKTAASDARVSFTTVKSYKADQTYGSVTTKVGAKLDSKASITVTLEKEYTVTFVLGTDKENTKGLTIDGTVLAPSDGVVTAKLSAGEHTVKNGGSETSVFVIVLAE